MARQEKTFNKLSLQKMCYYDVRDKFELSAQMVVRALGKVADSYQSDKKTKRNFKKYAAFPYDSRILSYRLKTQEVSHCIAKQLVNTAQGTERGIALEELTGIRRRARLRKSQRTPLHSWSFADLGSKIAYKAEMDGVPVVYVDPRNTRRMCSCCGHIDKGNRKTQDNFLCIACGFSAHADVNAAVNIGRRGSVNAPYADTA